MHFVFSEEVELVDSGIYVSEKSLRSLGIKDNSILWGTWIAEDSDQAEVQLFCTPVPPDSWASTFRLQIRLRDTAGSLALCSKVLAAFGLDVLASECVRTGMHQATWNIVVDDPAIRIWASHWKQLVWQAFRDSNVIEDLRKEFGDEKTKGHASESETRRFAERLLIPPVAARITAKMNETAWLLRAVHLDLIERFAGQDLGSYNNIEMIPYAAQEAAIEEILGVLTTRSNFDEYILKHAEKLIRMLRDGEKMKYKDEMFERRINEIGFLDSRFLFNYDIYPFYDSFSSRFEPQDRSSPNVQGNVYDFLQQWESKDTIACGTHKKEWPKSNFNPCEVSLANPFQLCLDKWEWPADVDTTRDDPTNSITAFAFSPWVEKMHLKMQNLLRSTTTSEEDSVLSANLGPSPQPRSTFIDWTRSFTSAANRGLTKSVECRPSPSLITSWARTSSDVLDTIKLQYKRDKQLLSCQNFPDNFRGSASHLAVDSPQRGVATLIPDQLVMRLFFSANQGNRTKYRVKVDYDATFLQTRNAASHEFRIRDLVSRSVVGILHGVAKASVEIGFNLIRETDTLTNRPRNFSQDKQANEAGSLEFVGFFSDDGRRLLAESIDKNPTNTKRTEDNPADQFNDAIRKAIKKKFENIRPVSIPEPSTVKGQRQSEHLYQRQVTVSVDESLPLFISTRFFHEWHDGILDKIRKLCIQGGFSPKIINYTSPRVTEDIIERMRQCSAFLQIIPVQRTEECFKDIDFTWLASELAAALVLRLPSEILVQCHIPTMTSDSWKAQLKIGDHTPMPWASEIHLLEEVLPRSLNELRMKVLRGTNT